MQIYANVASAPIWTVAKTEGRKGYWMFRVGEPQKDVAGQKQESTWYTVKDFSPEDCPPKCVKGDWVKILGSLQPAFWISTQTKKPSGTLYVTIFSIAVIDRATNKVVETETLAPVAKIAVVALIPVQVLAAPVAPVASIAMTLLAPQAAAANETRDEEVDDSYLLLCA